MTRTKGLISALLVVMASALYADYAVYRLGNRITRDEVSTCAIQARGLPAGHQLAASMKDIHSLLTLPPTSNAQRLATAHTPKHVLKLLQNLDGHLAAYQHDESKQPQTRTCS